MKWFFVPFLTASTLVHSVGRVSASSLWYINTESPYYLGWGSTSGAIHSPWAPTAGPLLTLGREFKTTKEAIYLQGELPIFITSGGILPFPFLSMGVLF